MSLRYTAGFIYPGYNPLKVPDAPTIGTATDSKTGGTVTVAFTAPSCVGGGAITGYTAVANCGAKFGSGSSSPITVTGLTNCTAYTFKVYANNSYGPSAYSAASNSVTPTAPVVGQQAYTTAGTYSWVAPTGVTSVSVVAVGGGGAGWSGVGGGGGGLTYRNNMPVTPGASYSVVVGAAGVSASSNGGNSTFSAGAFNLVAGGGKTSNSVPAAGGTSSGGAANYSGGAGYSGCGGGGGGGAAGYSGNGGNAGQTNTATSQAGSGGGGSGGVPGVLYCECGLRQGGASGGGGVGIFGEGTSGAAVTRNQSGSTQLGGRGGSGGTNGGNGGPNNGNGAGGLYGGGGAASGSVGAVRIIWPGTTRQFPSTCTGDK